MGNKLQIGLTAIGAALLIASAPIAADAQSGSSGLRIVAPPIIKQSTQRSIDSVRAGMKQPSRSGAKLAEKNAAKAGAEKAQKIDGVTKAAGRN
jgi:hypothetical protein